LKSLKPYFSRFGQAHHRLGRHGLLVAQAEPGVVGVGLAAISQVGAGAIADKKQIAQHFHRGTLLAFAKQSGHGQIQVLAQQVQHGGFHRGDRVDGGAQVKGLQATAASVTVCKLGAHSVHHGLHITDRLPHHQGSGIFDGRANFFAARHFTNARLARAVREDHDVAREKRAVCARQVHEHAVMSCHRNHFEVGDARG